MKKFNAQYLIARNTRYIEIRHELILSNISNMKTMSNIAKSVIMIH